ncbi:7112_t:CDS:2 [Entrophospora sp. SA101]|nr:7112_t:CDS:2 [Entrophospora sp. SA101]CAJ0910024.1 12052_t:CDS:2 [Entrophospora sp. SA101]
MNVDNDNNDAEFDQIIDIGPIESITHNYLANFKYWSKIKTNGACSYKFDNEVKKLNNDDELLKEFITVATKKLSSKAPSDTREKWEILLKFSFIKTNIDEFDTLNRKYERQYWANGLKELNINLSKNCGKTCNICTEDYDNTNIPITLDCSHELCGTCAEKVNYKCPFCRDESLV